ncbi:MAG: hypothetical protein NC036_00910 [Muribaculaceae bacterium]|nr:hypothetical protein [Muribaculaceae bacterium]
MGKATSNYVKRTLMSANTKNNYIYRTPAPGKIPVATWVVHPSDFKDMYECGFNVLILDIYVPTFNQIKDLKLSSLSEGNNISFILGDWQYYKDTTNSTAGSEANIKAYINRYKDNYYFGGIFLKNEVKSSDIEEKVVNSPDEGEPKKESSQLVKDYTTIYNNVGDNLIYFSLPINVNDTLELKGSILDHIADVEEKMTPSLWAYSISHIEK